ncbi:Phytochrome-like protein cph2 [compost metagenome]
MDDFGTGYSSLSYLKKFPIDVIKIDRSFIKDIPENQDDMEITSAVIAMAHKLKLKVVAGGIESAAQLSFLRRQHCDIGQGYLFDRPIAGGELIARLQRYPCRG